MKKNDSKKNPLLTELQKLYVEQRIETKKNWDRVLPFNELLFDRWEKGVFLKSKKGANLYDSSYVYGDVSIGKNTWIGPNTILDGSGGKLLIGDFCSISSGAQIYTHNTVNWALTGGNATYEKNNTRIGNNCYIGPNTIIAMGSKLGKCCVIGSQSLVNSKIPANSIAFGIPAKVVGKVSVKGKTVSFNYFDKNKN